MIKRRPVEIPDDVAYQLQKTAAQARRANRHSQAGTGDAKASENLTRILTFLVKERLVPVGHLAKTLGVSPSAISQRIHQEVGRWTTPSSGATPPED